MFSSDFPSLGPEECVCSKTAKGVLNGFLKFIIVELSVFFGPYEVAMPEDELVDLKVRGQTRNAYAEN